MLCFSPRQRDFITCLQPETKPDKNNEEEKKKLVA